MKQFLVTILTKVPDGELHLEDPIKLYAYCEEDAVIHAVQSRKSKRIRSTHRGTLLERLYRVNVARLVEEGEKKT
jgi:hypothetical protein